MADADADPGGESLDASPVPSPAHSPIAVDFDVSLLTFDDPDSTPSASDAGSAPLLTNEGAPAAFVQLETLPQRAFNRRALVCLGGLWPFCCACRYKFPYNACAW